MPTRAEKLWESASYLSHLYEQYPQTEYPGLWEILAYNKKGELIYNGVNIPDVVAGIGTPLRITFPEVATLRCHQWEAYSQKVATEVGYTGGLDYLYATKASQWAPITAAVPWDKETSSGQDLYNLLWLRERGMLGGKQRIVCNGYKPHPSRYNNPDVHTRKINDIYFEGEARQARRSMGDTYAEMVQLARNLDVEVVPIFDKPDEIDFFGQTDEMPPTRVGVRLKAYDVAKVNGDFEHLVSRHGMEWKTLRATADRIGRTPHLTLETFHAMIGAGETIRIEQLTSNLLLAAQYYFELRKTHPTLRYFNMGGGVTPLSNAYNHPLFLRNILSGMKEMAARYSQPEPTFVFEFGSLVAADAGMYVTSVLSVAVNHTEADGSTVPWALTDGSFMRGSIDMMLIGKNDYPIVAANNGTLPAVKMRLGGMTCDHDDIARTKDNNKAWVPWVPDSIQAMGGQQIMVVFGTEAYERALAGGFGGVGHCGWEEPKDAILYRDEKGRVHCYVEQHKTEKEAREAMGYNALYLPMLKALAKGK